MAAGLSDHVWSLEEIVRLLDADLGILPLVVLAAIVSTFCCLILYFLFRLPKAAKIAAIVTGSLWFVTLMMCVWIWLG
jgi:hypothetical protein